MEKNIFFILIFLGACAICPKAEAQDIEETARTLKERLKKDPVRLQGGISSDLFFSGISGLERRANPFGWRVLGFAHMDFLGLKLPASLVFASRSRVFNYELPAFAFVGLSPSYKWATLHLGDRTMDFGRYTFSGHSFRGAGLELAPGNFRFSAMYGQLRRAQAERVGSIQNVEPAYRRMGWGIKTGYDNGKDALLLTLFSSEDDLRSIAPVRGISGINPAENVIVGLSGRKQIGPQLSLEVEMARSALSSNINAPLLADQNIFLQRVGGLFTPRLSSGYYHAIRSDLKLETKAGNFQVGHEWVDPGYRTLGALYFNNDIERLTTGWTASLFKSKISLMSRFGLERNNLRGIEANDYRRFLTNIQLSYRPTRMLNFSGSYSNFSNTNRLRALDDPLSPIDSIVLALVNQNAGVGIQYLLQADGNAMIMAYLNWQEASSIQNDEVIRAQANRFLVGNLAYLLRLKEETFSVAPGLLLQRGQTGVLTTFTWAPNLNIGAQLVDKKLQLQAGLSYSNAYIDGKRAGGILNFRAGGSYSITDHHQLGLNLLLIDRSGSRTDFREFRGNLQYGWRFGQ